METLLEHIKSNAPRGFKPQSVYSVEGDSLTFIVEDIEYYRDRIDDFLTVFRTMDGDRLIGCQLKGVPEVLKLLGSFDLTINNSVKLTMIFLAFMTKTSKECQHFYVDLAYLDAARRAEIPAKALKQIKEIPALV
jgi:hypothetical protein